MRDATEYFDPSKKRADNIVYDPDSPRFNELPVEIQNRCFRSIIKDFKEVVQILKKN